MKTIFLQVPVPLDSLGVDMAQTTEPVEKTLSILELITSGGLGGQIIMLTLGVLSLLTVYFFWERFQVIKRAMKDDPQFMSKVKDYLSDDKVESVVALCERSSSPVANKVAKGALIDNGSIKDVQDAMERQGNLEVYKLEHNLASLATIAGAAPMIGFLGSNSLPSMLNTFADSADLIPLPLASPILIVSFLLSIAIIAFST